MVRHAVFHALFLVLFLPSSLLLQNYASADSTLAWYEYTIKDQSNGTSGETYFHVVRYCTHGGRCGEDWYPVSGKAVPWSDTVPSGLGKNYSEYCAMSTAIWEYFQNTGITPQDIRLQQFTDVGHDYGSPTNTKIETDFFVVLESPKYNSTMTLLGFYAVDSRYEHYSEPLLDCTSTSPTVEKQLELTREQMTATPHNEYSPASTPEFPFAIPVLLASIMSLIVFYRLKSK